MFKTKNLVHDIQGVPDTWIFETFCKLKEKLHGQDIKIKSLFNPKERTPSMCIFFNKEKQKYLFKDFSSGNYGGAVDLVKDLTGTNYYKACQLVIETYNDYVLHNNGGYDVKEFKESTKYRVVKWNLRDWTTQDQYFWTQFNIGSKLLDLYSVKPLQSYTMTNQDKELVISGNYLYGYFKGDGSLYKIYQPKTYNKKFLKVSDYIQGSEQTKDLDYLIITSSLKDIMSLRSLKINADIIAPDSENTIIKKDIMLDYIKKYKQVILLFDNDEAGIKSMIRYKELHPAVEMIILPLSKDPSDSIKDLGPKKVRETLVDILKAKVPEYS
jgi:hypothetical protein